MAICSFGPLIDGARGSIGGVTFSRAGSGATVRAKPRPPRPVRERQVEGQSFLGQAAAIWTTTSSITKTFWGTYGASITLYDGLARAYHPTGRQAFVWSYCVQASGGMTIDMTVPTGVGLAVVPTLTLEYLAHGLRLTGWTPAPAATDQLVFMTYRADRPRAFNRRGRAGLSLLDGADGLPEILVGDIDESWPIGTELKAFVGVRVIDENLRLSTRLMQGLEFTAA